MRAGEAGDFLNKFFIIYFQFRNVKVGHWSAQFAFEEILTKITTSDKSREMVEAYVRERHYRR